MVSMCLGDAWSWRGWYPLMDVKLIKKLGNILHTLKCFLRRVLQISKQNIKHQLKHIGSDILSHRRLWFLKSYIENKLVLQLQIFCQVCLES